MDVASLFPFAPIAIAVAVCLFIVVRAMRKRHIAVPYEAPKEQDKGKSPEAPKEQDKGKSPEAPKEQDKGKSPEATREQDKGKSPEAPKNRRRGNKE